MYDFDKVCNEILEFARENVKESRYEHTLRTAKKTVELCEKYHLKKNDGYLAGISHDICKDFSDEEMIALAKKDGKEITELEKAKPALLHGRCAAVLLEEKFGIRENDIIEAVQYHTFGKVGMCDLAKVLFIADKIEPGRPHVTEQYYKRLEKLTLNELMYIIVKENVDYLEKKQNSVAPQTYKLLEWIKEKK